MSHNYINQTVAQLLRRWAKSRQVSGLTPERPWDFSLIQSFQIQKSLSSSKLQVVGGV
jgi:hypothetical protein